MKKYLAILCFLCIAHISMFAQQIIFTPQWTPQSQFAGYYAAMELGYYAEEGLDVSISHPSRSYNSMNMLLDGSSNIITSELVQAIAANEQNIKLVNILQTTQHSTLVLLTRKKEVENMSQLRGSRIATWKVGFSEIPHIIDEQYRLDIEWIKCTNPLNLYIAGAIDATLAKSYNEQILFSMSGITPGTVFKFSEMGFDCPEDGLYVTEDFFKKYPEQCRKFAQASRKGWDWVRNNKDKALEIVMKYVKEENVPTNVYNQKFMLETILDVQADEKGGEPSYVLSEEKFNKLNSVLLQYGYITKPVEYKRCTGGKL